MRYYLDTSALVKRYVMEEGSESVDGIFEDALNGKNVIILSYWNIGEAATVFDKLSRRTKAHSAIKLMELMLGEFEELIRHQSIEIAEVSNSILKEAVRIVIKHHIYSADALQIITANREKADLFVSADRRLSQAAQDENLKIILIGNKN